MKKIINITLLRPKSEQTLEVGAKILTDGKESDVTVIKITEWFGVIRVYFSDGNMFVFKKIPYILIKK